MIRRARCIARGACVHDHVDVIIVHVTRLQLCAALRCPPAHPHKLDSGHACKLSAVECARALQARGRYCRPDAHTPATRDRRQTPEHTCPAPPVPTPWLGTRGGSSSAIEFEVGVVYRLDPRDVARSGSGDGGEGRGAVCTGSAEQSEWEQPLGATCERLWRLSRCSGTPEPPAALSRAGGPHRAASQVGG